MFLQIVNIKVTRVTMFMISTESKINQNAHVTYVKNSQQVLEGVIHL